MQLVAEFHIVHELFVELIVAPFAFHSIDTPLELIAYHVELLFEEVNVSVPPLDNDDVVPPLFVLNPTIVNPLLVMVGAVTVQLVP